MSKGFAIKNDVTYYDGLIYVPHSFRNKVIAACHSVAPFHHPGIKKTKSTIMRVFNWPNLHQDVADYIHSCLYCRRCSSGEERLQGLRRSHPIPGALDAAYMDFWPCLYDKNYLVLTLLDQLTKWAECVVIPNKSTECVTSIFLQSWIFRYGVPSKLVSDRDPSFISTLLNSLSSKVGITRIKFAPYHPEGNATIESFYLSTGVCHVNHKHLDINEAINIVQFGYRSTIHSTTNHSPSYLTTRSLQELYGILSWWMVTMRRPG